MPVSPIITIIFGLLVAFVLPEWIKFGDKKSRKFVQLVLKVMGIVIIVSGVVSCIRTL